MFVTWFSVLSAISFASAVPVSLYPVRPYVLLGPELPKFTLQPTVKVQSPAAIQPIPVVKSDPGAPAKQYVLVYPAYQYVTTRQDESGNTGFFETIQNYIVNFGQSQTQTQSDESSQIMDPVEPDKQQAMADATKTAFKTDTFQEKVNPTPSDSKQKLYYSFITPASTVPLNNDRRLFYLAEQPQVYGTFSGSAINPVFNLQPVPTVPTVPVVLSRSNVAQSDEPEPSKQVVAENVQAPQVPAGVVAVDQVPQVQVKSGISAESDSVVVEAAPENRIVPTVAPVEANRDIPISTEATVDGTVVARSNAVPFTVSGEPVPFEVVPKVVSNVEGIEPVPSSGVQSFVEAQPFVAPPSAVPDDVPPTVYDKSIQGVVPSVVQNSESVVENVKSVDNAQSVDNVQSVDSVKSVSASV